MEKKYNIGFNEYIIVRLNCETLQEIKNILEKDKKREKPKYYGKISNYIRVAIIKLNRFENKEENKKV